MDKRLILVINNLRIFFFYIYYIYNSYMGEKFMLLIKCVDKLMFFVEEFIYMIVYLLCQIYSYRKVILVCICNYAIWVFAIYYYLKITNG